MTVAAFAQPFRATVPASRQSWSEFVVDSLDQGWRTNEWDPVRYSFAGVLDSPMTGISICLRDGCVVVVDGSASLCSGCRKVQAKLPAGTPLPSRDPVLWQSSDLGGAAKFSLSELTPELRHEILFGLQDRDRQQLAIRPYYVRLLVERIPAETTHILDLKDTDYRGMERALLRSLQQSIQRLKLLYNGGDGTEGDIWDCALVGLIAKRDQSYRAVTGQLDFTVIRQQWLRRITREVLKSLRPNVADCQRYIHAATIASSVLTGRPNGDRPSRLSAGDMTAICQAIATANKPETGNPYSDSHRRAILGWWRRLTEYARGGSLMDDIPGVFAVRPEHMAGPVSESEDDIGRAIPEEWTAYLDGQMELLGTDSNYAPKGWSATDLRDMYRVFYQVLRDTGRRPSEIARLSGNCLEYVRGEPTLIYDNRKAGRNGRRLPIDKSTAGVIERWSQRLKSMHVPPGCEGYLFPAPGARNRERQGHLNSSQFRKAFNSWVVLVPQPTGFSEAAAAFPAEQLGLYGFRHAYAQRHADNGTPVDVLRDLMDHREIDTTMGYYQVSLARKQKAVSLVSQLAVDRNGSSAPFITGTAYERASVATAYGNCTEPSNVKAGGKSCPIRFQCSGCGFYRPDPSYVGAIEQQLAQLRADRAIALASDVAQWVLDNLDAQIVSYERIAETMRTQLDALPDQEREAITSACTDLRKARQVALIPTESLRRRLDDNA